MSIDKSTICNILNEYCFANIWNESASESRVNIAPRLVNNSRSCTGYCLTGSKALYLPYTDKSFFVYTFRYEDTKGSLATPKDTWINLVDLCNVHDILIKVYTPEGRMLSFKEGFIQKCSDNNTIFLAVTKKGINRIKDENRDIYLTIYKDPDKVGNVTVYSYNSSELNPITHRIYVATKSTISRMKHECFIDGYYYTTDTIESVYNHTQDIDIIYDDDIVGVVDIPITTDPHPFYSTKDRLYKEIIHIPKSINPSNKVITHDSCTLYVLDPNNRGTYLHYTANKSIGQITHNDLSIPTYILDAHKDYLETTDVHIQMKIRLHQKDNVLIPNQAYIDILYNTQSDEDIIAHLQGKLASDLEFWTANQLEQHPYVQMMYDVPNIITPSNLEYYIDTLGYYHTISLICKRIHNSTITPYTSRIFCYNKPAIWESSNIFPIVYVNGQKIHNDYVSYLSSNKDITIKLHNDVVLNVGDIVTTIMCPIGDRKIYTIVPSEEQDTITIPNKNFSIYQEIHYLDTNETTMYEIVNKGYRHTTLLENEGKIAYIDNGDGTITLQFNTQVFGTTYHIIHDEYTQYLNYNLDNQIEDGRSMIVDLEGYSTTEDYIPLFNVKDTFVYLNGKYLVNGVDYKFVKYTNINNDIIKIQLCIQNMSYVKSENNQLEVIATTVEVTNTDYGYVVHDTASRDIDVDIWFKSLTTLHISGMYESEVHCTGIGLELPEGKYSDGKLFGLKTTIPKSIQDLLLPINDDIEISRITTIDNYLQNTIPEYQDDVILPYSHKIYSSYLHYLIVGIVNDTVTLTYDPDIEKMKIQLSNYDYLKQYDVIFNDIPINTRYVDIYPTYLDLLIIDDQKAKLIYTLKQLILGDDNITSGVLTDEQP